ncbi:zinc-binding dehydrogenase [Microbacterium sp. NPDC089320]|uniref:zinc-binding dehydrogenase n=1 Tax=Microbacterium sp. NPDC089320 TaxID=3155182 RepID=UPI003420D414
MTAQTAQTATRAMTRMVCTALGEGAELEARREPVPSPASGEVVVELLAAGVSFVDALVVRGGYQVSPDLPFTPGNCLVGTVVAVGYGAPDTMLGSVVAAVLDGLGGAFSTHVVLPADGLAIVPDGVDPVPLAAAIESYLTVLFAATHRVSIEPGDRVVVLGAAGGIGSAAIDIARSRGARIVAVASSDEKRQAALARGAEAAIGYDELKQGIRAATGSGADIVIDPVGGEATEQALRALGEGGRLLVLGFASGGIPRLPVNQVLLSNRSVIGVDWGDWIRRPGGRVRNVALLEQLLALFASGELQPARPTAAPLAEAGRVLALISGRDAVGKHVLVPS